jgi:hypothetical protein
MTSDERRREERLKQLVHDVHEAQATAQVVAAKAVMGEVRFVESLFERRVVPRQKGHNE